MLSHSNRMYINNPFYLWFAFLASLYSSNALAGNIPYQTEWLENHYQERLKEFRLHPLKTGDIVFIGDSLTELGMDWGERFNNTRVKNRGIQGDMTYGVLARLDELKANPPKAIFIMIGINDIFNLYYQKQIQRLSSVSENIGKITERLHSALPQTPIYVQSLLPDHRDFITVMASSVNLQIQAIENKKFTYIDLHSFFVSDKGVINPNLTTDGTHLNQKGYNLWRERLLPVMRTLP